MGGEEPSSGVSRLHLSSSGASRLHSRRTRAARETALRACTFESMLDQPPVVETAATPRRRRWAGPGARLAVLGVFIVFAAFFPRACVANSGEYAAALGAVRACPQATALLGDDIHTAWLGCVTGRERTSSSSGSAKWRVPLTGTKGSGVYHFTANRKGEAWSLTSGTLDTGGETIDVYRCVRAADTSLPASSSARTGQ